MAEREPSVWDGELASDDAGAQYAKPDRARLDREIKERNLRDAQEATEAAKNRAIAAGHLDSTGRPKGVPLPGTPRPASSIEQQQPRPVDPTDGFDQAAADAAEERDETDLAQAIAEEAAAFEAAGGDASYAPVDELEEPDAGDQA